MRKVALIAILCLLIPLGACSKDPIPVKSPRVQRAAPVEVKAQPQQAVEPEDAAQPKFYAYDPQGRRDPFLSLVKITKRKVVKKKGASPMESFSVEEIKLLAIASDKDENYALIILPNQKSFTIRKGMVLGLEGGKVEEITAEKVVIREYFKDYRGDLKPKDTVLKLHKGEE
jgi:type IV pilus assembly protein PilP